MRSPRVPQLVTRYNRLDKRAPILVVDAIKCRRQLLAHLSPCVFSVWDEIRPVNRELMDFMFISKAAPANQIELQMMAPHLGPAWRTKETVAWLLNNKLLNNKIIEWDDLPYGINCTCRLPAGFAMEALDNVVQALQAIDEDLGSKPRTV